MSRVKRDEFTLVYEGIYAKLYFHPVHRIIIQEWKERNIEMDDAAFKEHSLLMSEKIEAHNARYLLINNSLRVYRLPPEVQEWYMLNIALRYKNMGIKKVAIAANTDLLLHLSIEDLAQLIKYKREDILIAHRFFEHEAAALSWLIGSVDSGSEA